MKYSRSWENIGFNLDRLPVPGGWLVRSEIHDSRSMVFVQDIGYLWDIETEEEQDARLDAEYEAEEAEEAKAEAAKTKETT